MSKEITITFNAQITAVDRLTDAQYLEACEAGNYSVTDMKKKIEENFKRFVLNEAPADDVVITDLKIFELDRLTTEDVPCEP